jgi:Rhs element Vgr protein
MSIIDTILPITANTNLVSYDILINDDKISSIYHIMSISIHEEINKISSARIVVRDGSGSAQTFEVTESGQFAPGKKIRVLLGYNNTNEPAFSGVIVSNTIKVYSGYSEMIIECRDPRVRMTATPKGKHFMNCSDDEVIRQLLEQNDTPDVKFIKNPGDKSMDIRHEQLIQSSVSDWDFMISRIDVSGRMSLLHDGVMIVRKPDFSAEPSLAITYGANLLEFSAEMDSRIQHSEVHAYTWDDKEQTVRKTIAEDPSGIDKAEPDEKKAGTIKELVTDLAAVLKEPYEIRTVSMSQDQQQAISDAKKSRQIASSIQGKVKYQGTVSALPGSMLKLNGLGDKFSKKLLVSAIQHEYAEGNWITEATLGWEQQFFAESIRPLHAASATGQISAVNGLCTAIVQGLEDETGQFRVRLRLPLVDNTNGEVYARLATLDAGKDRGTFFLPEIDDEVLIGFLNDDPSRPVILGMLHSTNKPAPLDAKDTNHQKGYVSRSGIRMIFHDDKKKLLIKTPDDRTIDLDDDTKEIKIQDGFGNSIIMDSNGISIVTKNEFKVKADKAISFQTGDFSLQSDQSVQEATGRSTISSGGDTVIKGSYVKIN